MAQDEALLLLLLRPVEEGLLTICWYLSCLMLIMMLIEMMHEHCAQACAV